MTRYDDPRLPRLPERDLRPTDEAYDEQLCDECHEPCPEGCGRMWKSERLCRGCFAETFTEAAQRALDAARDERAIRGEP